MFPDLSSHNRRLLIKYLEELFYFFYFLFFSFFLFYFFRARSFWWMEIMRRPPCIVANESSSTWASHVCTRCNQVHSCATQCTSRLSHRSANNGFGQQHKHSRGNSFYFFFLFRESTVSTFWLIYIAAQRSHAVANESSRTWALSYMLCVTEITAVQRSASLNFHIHSAGPYLMIPQPISWDFL